jgi:hypothetical protein
MSSRKWFVQYFLYENQVGSDLWLLETIASLDISIFAIICEFVGTIFNDYKCFRNFLMEENPGKLYFMN